MKNQGRIQKIGDIKDFILGGKAIFTLQNIDTQNRVTYKVVKLDGKNKPYFVWFLSGSNNESDYSYLGMIDQRLNFRATRKSPSVATQTFKGFNWLWNNVSKDNNLPEVMHFYHEGCCCRCGRKLTTPESILNGIGPICMKIKRS